MELPNNYYHHPERPPGGLERAEHAGLNLNRKRGSGGGARGGQEREHGSIGSGRGGGSGGDDGDF